MDGTPSRAETAIISVPGAAAMPGRPVAMVSVKLLIRKHFRYCSTPFFAESNTVQTNILPIIVYEEFLVTTILDLIKSFLAGSFHFIKALCIL